jgi:PIN domain nuclease of toxin-antitoxin system
MNYLLDTHSLIWAVCMPEKLSKTAKSIIQDAENDILVSVVSLWEISIKHSLGKLSLEGLLPEDFLNAATATGLSVIGLEAESAATMYRLAATYHRDPFDRMLIWQSIVQNYTLISKDEQVHEYKSEGLKVLW